MLISLKYSGRDVHRCLAQWPWSPITCPQVALVLCGSRVGAIQCHSGSVLWKAERKGLGPFPCPFHLSTVSSARTGLMCFGQCCVLGAWHL